MRRDNRAIMSPLVGHTNTDTDLFHFLKQVPAVCLNEFLHREMCISVRYSRRRPAFAELSREPQEPLNVFVID